MNYILFAVPFFFVLIALELLADRWRGWNSYRFSDSLNSLSAGVLSTTSGLLTKGLGIVTYAFAWQHLAVFELAPHSLVVWLCAFVGYDFCYYWNHRLGHERNVLWAAHAVHHQSEEYNLTTALRQTSTGFVFGWLFYLPMAVIGVPPLVFLSVAALNLLYQFWVHTRHIPKLGVLEWLFITPSNHRVHHAQNPLYMDRNYGGVFIVWDRLFGTFQEELDEEPVVFGVTVPLASWNPLWANLQVYAQLWHDAVNTQSTWDKLRIWFMRTGWRPADVARQEPLRKSDLAGFRKFDVPLTRGRQLYALLQFSLHVLGGTLLLGMGEKWPLSAVLLGWGGMAFGLFAIGAWLEDRAWAGWVELLRLLSLPLVLLALAHVLALSPPPWSGPVLMIYVAFSLLALAWLRRVVSPRAPA